MTLLSLFPRRCIVCMEIHLRGLVCDRGHLVCRSCMRSYINSYEAGPLLCPLNNIHMGKDRCTSDSYKLSKIKRYSGGHWDDFYDKYKQSTSTIILYGMQKLYMCPQCGYGPVLKTGCDDLLRHHYFYSYSDNSCRRCHWFSPSIHDWKSWTGCYSED